MSFNSNDRHSDLSNSDYQVTKVFSSDLSSFQNPVQNSVRALADNNSIWNFLAQGGYNCVSYTVAAHPFPGMKEDSIVVKKETFPSKPIFLCRHSSSEFIIKIGKRDYSCFVSPERTAFFKLPKEQPLAAAIHLEKKHKRVFILNGTGLYQLKIDLAQVLVINTDPEQLSKIEKIVANDSRAPTQSYFQLTSAMVGDIQALCPEFCTGVNPKPVLYNTKTRSVRLLRNFYPTLPVYAVDDRTLLMPFLEQSVNADEIIREAIRIFIAERRIIADMCIVNNFKKDLENNTYLTDPDMAFSVGKRQRSRGSLLIEEQIVHAKATPEKPNLFQQFLAKEARGSVEQHRLVLVTQALIYLAQSIEDLDTIPPEWIDENWLQLIYFFLKSGFILESDDLKLMHLFSPLMNQIGGPILSKYHFHYLCLQELIDSMEEASSRLYLETLSNETVAHVLVIQAPHSLLDSAVLTYQLTMVRLLLEFGASPLLPNEKDNYHALDWAIFRGHWELVTDLVSSVSTCTTVNRHRLWAAKPKTIIPIQDAVAAMAELDTCVQFHWHLLQIKTLAQRGCSEEHLDKVHTLVRLCKQYLMNQDWDLECRKKVFIKNCIKTLNESLPNLRQKEESIAMQTAIRDLKNGLSLARDPTLGCTIS